MGGVEMLLTNISDNCCKNMHIPNIEITLDHVEIR